jgi:hypothetical protein
MMNKQQGIFFDEYDDAFMNETRCLQRALDFRVFCHATDSPEAVSALYAPTAKLFVVSQLGPTVHDAAASANALVAPPPAAAAADAVNVAGNEGEEAVTFVFNSTVRTLWAVARAPPAFASRAVPLALFHLAGEYLDCRAPPLPLVSATSTAATPAQAHASSVSRYHCNGPHAHLAVEALQLYLSVVPTHADAHYNLGVAFYTLTELDNAVGCFVAALRCITSCIHVRQSFSWRTTPHCALFCARSLHVCVCVVLVVFVCVVVARRLEPDHSLALGALGTVLTQQGRFQHAWDILDARVRPPRTPSELRAARDRAEDAAAARAAAAGTNAAAVEADAGAGAERATTTAAADAASESNEPAAAHANEKQPWWKFGIGRLAGKGKTSAPIALTSAAKAKGCR